MNPLPLSLEDLKAQISNGEPFRYLFFWGHRSKGDGQVSKSCLSQWRPASFELNGVTYATAEHFMMAEKARLFQDPEILAQILASPDPDAAKALGRKVKNFEPALWAQHRFNIVVRGNRAKFAQNPRLREYLEGTRGQVLVEASPYDLVWGIGFKEQAQQAQDPLQWRGENRLGFALMTVRDQD